MTMPDILFYLFAALTLGCGLLVVANPWTRNPVTSAMFLVLAMISLAGLFTLLHAFFLAAVQVLVYAGAVMVLFLFVIMLLDLKTEERRKINKFMVVPALLVAGGFLGLFLRSLPPIPPGGAPAPVLEGSAPVLGKVLFLQYALPFEVISLLLLVAMVGVILLSKKDLR